MGLFARSSCIILSAGSSLRMGTHKALLKFDRNITFIQKEINTYSEVGVEQIIVVTSPELYRLLQDENLTNSQKVTLVINEKPEAGRFYSLQSGVAKLKPGYHSFFQNIDNPFTSTDLLKELIKHKDEADVIIPTFRNKAGHPVLLSDKVLKQVLNEKDTDVRIDQFLKKFSGMRIETSENRILANINSQEEYRKAGLLE